MQKQCVWYEREGKPGKLSKNNPDDICEQCREAGREREQSPAGHEELFRAAHTLFRHGVEDEHQIIPTLVFAAMSDQERHFRDVRRRFAEATSDEAWGELRQQWTGVFADLWVDRPLLDGVLLLWLKNFFIQPYPVGPGWKAVDRIAIHVFRRSDTPDDLERLYGDCLAQNSIPPNDYCGSIAWTCSEGGISLLVRPEDDNVHPPGERFIRAPRTELVQRPFPSPKVLRSIYEGVLETLPVGVVTGRKAGPQPSPYNLVLACVAWYVGDRGEQVKRPQARPELAKLLNDTLLRPHGLESLPQSPENYAVWQRASNDSFSSYVMRVESQLNKRGWLLDKYF
jgi:hypothetical protein